VCPNLARKIADKIIPKSTYNKRIVEQEPNGGPVTSSKSHQNA
jgi:hypothetical protein